MQIRIRRYHVIGLAALLPLASAFYRKTPKAKALNEPADPVKVLAAVPEPAARPDGKSIALTFDDGPHPQYTERILDILKQYQVPCTFFLVGKQVERYPDLVRKIFREGHEIENHTYSHRDLRTLSKSELSNELEKTGDLVKSITAQKMKYFRPPGGHYNAAVVKIAGDLGYKMALWTVFPKDHSNPPLRLIQERILKNSHGNEVVLLHSGIENTLKALPDLITSLRKEGFRFVRLSENGP